jgi:hypothetical protein
MPIICANTVTGQFLMGCGTTVLFSSLRVPSP